MKQWLRKLTIFFHLDEMWYGRDHMQAKDRRNHRYKINIAANEGGYADRSPEIEIEDTLPLLPVGTHEPYHLISRDTKPNRKLSEKQRILIHRSWKRLRGSHSVDRISSMIFGHLCRTTDAKGLAISLQFIRVVVQTLDYAAKYVDRMDLLYQIFVQIGRTLIYSAICPIFHQKHWDSIALSVMEVVSESLRRDKTYQNTIVAWRLLVCFFVDTMAIGYHNELRALKRSFRSDDLSLSTS